MTPPGPLDAVIARHAPRLGRDGLQKLVVLRDGVPIHAGPEADAPQGLWSITKSVLGLTLGLLVDDRRLALDQPLADVLPELASTYPAATVRHFASMISGYRAQGDDAPIKGYAHGPSRTPFRPAPTPLFAPGTAYAYWDSAPNMLAKAMTRVAGEPLASLFARRIADPLGIRFAWGAWLEDGILVNGGAGNHYGAVQMSARDAATLGELMRAGGRWNGTALLSKGYVAEAVATQVPRDLALVGDLFDGRGCYGLFWWTNGAGGAHRKWPGLEPGTFSASGYNNNDLFVLPTSGITIVRLGEDQDFTGPISDADYEALILDIIAAL